MCLSQAHIWTTEVQLKNCSIHPHVLHSEVRLSLTCYRKIKCLSLQQRNKAASYTLSSINVSRYCVPYRIMYPAECSLRSELLLSWNKNTTRLEFLSDWQGLCSPWLELDTRESTHESTAAQRIQLLRLNASPHANTTPCQIVAHANSWPEISDRNDFNGNDKQVSTQARLVQRPVVPLCESRWMSHCSLAHPNVWEGKWRQQCHKGACNLGRADLSLLRRLHHTWTKNAKLRSVAFEESRLIFRVVGKGCVYSTVVYCFGLR